MAKSKSKSKKVSKVRLYFPADKAYSIRLSEAAYKKHGAPTLKGAKLVTKSQLPKPAKKAA